MEREGSTLMPEVLVSMVSFNTRNFLEKSLGDLERQKTKARIQIVVLDNNSEDGSQDMVSSKFPEVKLIKSHENLGFAKGQNKILSQFKADFYLLVNPDTRIPDDAVEKMVSFLALHPGCGILSCRLTDFNGGLHPNGGDLPFNLALLAWLFNLESFGLKTNFHRSDSEYYEQSREAGWVGGTFMMIRKEVLEKAGLFNPLYFMYVEDVDLCYKALKKGFKIMINSEIEIKHKSGASSKDPKFYQWSSEFKNLILFYRENLGLIPSICLKLLIYISVFLRMIVFALLGKGGKSFTYAKVFASI